MKQPRRRTSKDAPAKLAKRMRRRWRVVLLRAKGEILGQVEATDAQAADGQIALNTAIGQADGAGTMIEAGVLKRAAKESETLRVALVRQEHALAAQTQQVAACNALHELEERLSRWLLQSRDLLNSDTLPLTKDFLAQMAVWHMARPTAGYDPSGSAKLGLAHPVGLPRGRPTICHAPQAS
jgi:hypothetical protein